MKPSQMFQILTVAFTLYGGCYLLFDDVGYAAVLTGGLLYIISRFFEEMGA